MPAGLQVWGDHGLLQIDETYKSLALHSHDVPGYKYKMWKTVFLPANATATQRLDFVERAQARGVAPRRQAIRWPAPVQAPGRTPRQS